MQGVNGIDDALYKEWLDNVPSDWLAWLQCFQEPLSVRLSFFRLVRS